MPSFPPIWLEETALGEGSRYEPWLLQLGGVSVVITIWSAAQLPLKWASGIKKIALNGKPLSPRVVGF